jgi:FSR family fosmidomycin resistance protein-like MFS transporter
MKGLARLWRRSIIASILFWKGMLMSLLRNRSLVAVSLGHFTIDLFNSMNPVLLAFFSVSLGLSNAQIGLAASLYTLAASLFQPGFGWLADRHGGRWFGAGGLLWTLGLLSLAVILGQSGMFLLLIPFVLAAVGSAAYHPQGIMHATDVGEGRQASGAAIFFFFGQAGLALGPALAGLILGQVGPGGIPTLALIGLPVTLWLATTLRPDTPPNAPAGHQPTAIQTQTRLAVGVILALTGLIALRAWANFGITTFLPKFYQEKGWAPESYGLVASMLMMGSAVGGVFGGPAADRWGRRLIVAGTLFTAILPLIFLPVADGATVFVVAAFAGAMLGASHSIIVVLAQTLLPGGKAMASGLTLGFMFASGAVGGIISGWMADRIGLTLTLQSVALVALGAALCALALPATRAATRKAKAVMVPPV